MTKNTSITHHGIISKFVEETWCAPIYSLAGTYPTPEDVVDAFERDKESIIDTFILNELYDYNSPETEGEKSPEECNALFDSMLAEIRSGMKLRREHNTEAHYQTGMNFTHEATDMQVKIFPLTVHY